MGQKTKKNSKREEREGDSERKGEIQRTYQASEYKAREH
jgi:hypothetical protein